VRGGGRAQTPRPWEGPKGEVRPASVHRHRCAPPATRYAPSMFKLSETHEEIRKVARKFADEEEAKTEMATLIPKLTEEK